MRIENKKVGDLVIRKISHIDEYRSWYHASCRCGLAVKIPLDQIIRKQNVDCKHRVLRLVMGGKL